MKNAERTYVSPPLWSLSHGRGSDVAGGFALVEMMVVLVLLGVFTLIASELFAQTLKVSTQATRGQAEMNRFDGLLDQLRRDVWNARSMSTLDSTHLGLIQAPDRIITWTVEEGGRVHRTCADGGQVEHTYVNLPPLSFVVAGPLLRVQVRAVVVGGGGRGGRDSDNTQEITLVSQVLLAEARQ